MKFLELMTRRKGISQLKRTPRLPAEANDHDGRPCDSTKMIICDKSKCTGCAACINICPCQCITMEEDEFGVPLPRVDDKLCRHCNLCVSICPNNLKQNFRYPAHCYAAWNIVLEKRKKCASGEVSAVLSEYVISVKQGVVFGVAYSHDLTPMLTYCETIAEIERFKGSKYVQAKVGPDMFIKAKQFLDNGRFVLFVSTPCQVAGLKAFLGKGYPNLVTVDLICHGVVPNRYFADELATIFDHKKINPNRITDVRFRGNDGIVVKPTFWDKFCNKNRSANFTMTLWENTRQRDGEIAVHCKDANESCYLAGFLEGITLRENCYQCKYATPERISDLTIGDFIGIGSRIPFAGPDNVSSVTTNTDQGENFFRKVRKCHSELRCEERSYSERLDYRPSLMCPFPRSELRDKFLAAYQEMGWQKASARVIGRHLLKMRAINLASALIQGCRRIFGLRKGA